MSETKVDYSIQLAAAAQPSLSKIPHNCQAEEAVLGAVLISPESFPELSVFLRSDSFYIHRHRWIWEAFLRLQEQQLPIDIITLSGELEKTGALAEIGGQAYLTCLLNQVPTSLHAVHYGEIVEGCAIRRRILAAANQIAANAYDEEKDPNNLVGDSLEAIQKAALVISSADTETVAALARQHYDQTVQRAEEIRTGKTSIIPTGYIDLDTLLRLRSKFVLLAGRPGKGKTSFALNVAIHAAQAKKKVGIFSGEMSKDEIENVLLSILSGIDSQRLEEGNLREDEWPIYTAAIETLSALPIEVIDNAGLTIPYIRSRCLLGLYDLVIVDYLMLLQGHSDEKNIPERIGLLSRDLKIMQRELGNVLLCIHHMNRGVEQRNSEDVPRLSDLFQAGERDPDVIVFIHYERSPVADKEGRIVVRVIVEKHRRGPKGEVELLFTPYCTLFETAYTTFSPRR